MMRLKCIYESAKYKVSDLVEKYFVYEYKICDYENLLENYFRYAPTKLCNFLKDNVESKVIVLSDSPSCTRDLTRTGKNLVDEVISRDSWSSTSSLDIDSDHTISLYDDGIIKETEDGYHRIIIPVRGYK